VSVFEHYMYMYVVTGLEMERKNDQNIKNQIFYQQILNIKDELFQTKLRNCEI
jgi:hypothetical protein